MATHTSPITPPSLNHLRRGAIYCARTRSGSTVGEYLGMESSHGERAILLRHGSGTESIPVDEVASIRVS